MMIYCPKCEASCSDTEPICPKCEYPLAEWAVKGGAWRECPDCKKRCPNMDTKCQHCGTNFAAHEKDLAYCPKCKKPCKRWHKRCPHCAVDILSISRMQTMRAVNARAEFQAFDPSDWITTLRVVGALTFVGGVLTMIGGCMDRGVHTGANGELFVGGLSICFSGFLVWCAGGVWRTLDQIRWAILDQTPIDPDA